MNIKLPILSLIILLTITLRGQGLKIDSNKTSSFDSSSLILKQTNLVPSKISKNNDALVIINGKKFDNCPLQNIFFEIDTANISAIHVLNSKSDSIKFYGKAGIYGVIFIKTKKPIVWISIHQILKQKSNQILSKLKKTLIKVDDVFFATDEELYFQKNLIDSISVLNNITEYYLDKKFNSVVKISIKKKRDY